jgi:NAD(P)-dependent dehydrogenase (short-subunit alcohol dehydrogenase family)
VNDPARSAIDEIAADILDAQLDVKVRSAGSAHRRMHAAVESRCRASEFGPGDQYGIQCGQARRATLASYSATKAAVVGFAEALHDELSTACD